MWYKLLCFLGFHKFDGRQIKGMWLTGAGRYAIKHHCSHCKYWVYKSNYR